MPETVAELEPLAVERPETVGDFARLALEHQAEPLDRPITLPPTDDASIPREWIEAATAPGGHRWIEAATEPAGRRWGWLVVLAWLALPALVAALIWTGDQRYAWTLLPAGLAALVVHGAHAAGRAA